MKIYTVLCASTVILSSGVSTAAFAQAAQPASSPEALAADRSGLEEIVVTAQKRSENLQKVPIAVTARTGDDLIASGIQSTTQLNGVTAGLNIRTGLGSLQPTIRGVGTSINVGENTSAIYIDGVYMPSQRDSLRDFNDIEQVAVLKGPQGTLFGRNATGGVIQITTRTPSHDFHGEIGGSYGNYQTFRSNAYVTGGISEAVSASLSANYAHQSDGYGTNLTTRGDNYQLRHQYGFMSKLLIEPGSDTRITLSADYMNRAQRDNLYVPYPGTSIPLPSYVPVSDRFDSRGGRNSTLSFNGGGGSATIDHDFGVAKLLSISAYRKSKFDFLADVTDVPTNEYAFQLDRGYNNSFTQELQLVSPKSDSVTWVAGVYFIHSVIGNGGLNQLFGGLFSFIPNYRTVGREAAKSGAAFGQLAFHLSDETKVTLGARYTAERRRFTGTKTTVATPAPLIQNFNGRINANKFNYRVSIDHNFTPDLLGYAAISTGFKSGGANVFSPDAPGFAPENLTDYEAGFKAELFDRRLRVNASIFYYDYKNIQVSQGKPGEAQIITTNGAAAELYGIDLDIDARLARGLTVSAGLELLHPEYTDYKNASCSTVSPGGGATQFLCDATGNRLQGAQRYAVTSTINYETATSIGGLRFNLSTNLNGNSYFEPDNFIRQKAYVDMNMSVEWTPTDAISLTLWARNILDNKVLTQAVTTPFIYAVSYGQPPRTYGVSGRLKF